jgi:hypothetical protein
MLKYYLHMSIQKRNYDRHNYTCSHQLILPLKHLEICQSSEGTRAVKNTIMCSHKAFPPLRHAEILPAYVYPVKELGQSQVHVFTSSNLPDKTCRHITCICPTSKGIRAVTSTRVHINYSYR